MVDATVILEERKEITTFLLDEGTVSEGRITTMTGESQGYIYSGDKVNVDDVVTLSTTSEIGRPAVKKFTGEEGQVILGVAVNEPQVMSGGIRKTAILVLGHLFRFKLAKGLSNIKVNDMIALTSTGAIVDAENGEYYAMHPVASSDEYEYIEVFKPYDKSA